MKAGISKPSKLGYRTHSGSIKASGARSAFQLRVARRISPLGTNVNQTSGALVAVVKVRASHLPSRDQPNVGVQRPDSAQMPPGGASRTTVFPVVSSRRWTSEYPSRLAE